MTFTTSNKWGTALVGVLVGLILVGCGGGGGGDDDDESTSPAQNSTPAAESIGGQTVTFYTAESSSRSITFTTENTWAEDREGATGMGTYQYRRVGSGSSAELLLSETGNNFTIVLTFNSPSSGSFIYVGQPGEGTFNMQPATGPISGSHSPPNEGLAPRLIAGRTMFGTRTFTSTGPVGQTHVYTFSTSAFHDSDPPEESDGSYLYEPSGNNATLRLSYFSPAAFNGDRHELQMTFHTENAGIFESIYTRRDGTVIRINGTFGLE